MCEGLFRLHSSNNPNECVGTAASQLRLTLRHIHTHTKHLEAGRTVSGVAVSYPVNLERGMNGFFRAQVLLLLRLVQRLKHWTVHELLLWHMGDGLPRQRGRRESCASL